MLCVDSGPFNHSVLSSLCIWRGSIAYGHNMIPVYRTATPPSSASLQFAMDASEMWLS